MTQIIVEADLEADAPEVVVVEHLPNRAQVVAAYVAAGLAQEAAERLEERAERIQRIKQRTIFDIGRELLAAQEEAKHGTWGPFLRRIDLAETTARNYMNVAERFGDAPALISATVADLPEGIQYALAAPRANPAAVEQVIAEVAAGAPVPPVKDVKQRVASKPKSPPTGGGSGGAGGGSRTTATSSTPPPPPQAPAAPVALTPLAPAPVASADLAARKALAAKHQLLAAALELVRSELERTTTDDTPAIAISDGAIRLAATGFVNSPALASAAALLAMSATVEEAVEV